MCSSPWSSAAASHVFLTPLPIRATTQGLLNPGKQRRCVMAKTIVLGLVVGLAFIALAGAILFACAGRWDLPMFWAYLGVWLASMLVGMFLLDPSLIKERMHPGPGGKDYLSVFVVTPLWLG